jgi:hypothetical protein
MSDTSTAITENRTKLNDRLAKLRSNRDLSEAARKRMADEAKQEAAAKHQELIAEHERAQKQRLESAERRVFSPSYPSGVVTDGQRQAFRGELRDASIRLFEVSDDTLQRAKDRGRRTQDPVLQQAAYFEAVDRGAFSIAEEYRTANDGARIAWDTYKEVRSYAESPAALIEGANLRKATPGSS